MKTRRELVSNLMIDISKSVLVAVLIARILNKTLISSNNFLLLAIVFLVVFAVAVIIHPKSTSNKNIHRS